MGRVAFKVLMDSLWNKEIAGCYTVDGFIQVLQVRAYTAMRNWVLVLVVPEQTVRLHRYWLTRAARPQINESCYLESVFTSIKSC
ncbi:hypothetical protein Bca52824_086904 [Brassica carinata]|uniref:Uncharacterized protein n=1 Tax=Brassica carinata TaxID=52824 RepID=A0A8X7TN34_BRACI|nr:hypothetical protein Bca52824_086904 [Brassica carinata]